MVKFTWSDSLGVGKMKVSDKFNELNPVAKLDFIQDMMYYLKELQVKSYNECYPNKEVK
jgi:hypothetical protein